MAADEKPHFGKVPSSLFGDKILEFVGMDISKEWKPLELLGSGTYSQVFKVESLKDHKQHALKLVDFSEVSPEIIREVCVPRRINHPNIIQINDVNVFEDPEIGPSKRTLGIVMRIYDGSLNYLTPSVTSYRLSLRTYKEIFFQLLVSLFELKKYNIIHADIKPGNIFFHFPYTREEFCEVALGDFGICQSSICDRDQIDTSVMYTLQYRPPELTHPSGKYYFGSEIWALAATFYEFFTDKYLFDVSTLKELVNLHNKFSGISKDAINNSQLRNLLNQMLRRDPESRPSVEECLTHPFFDDIWPGMVSWYKSKGYTLDSKNWNSSPWCDEKVLNKFIPTVGNLRYTSERKLLLGNYYDNANGWVFDVGLDYNLSFQTVILAASHVEHYLTANANQMGNIRDNLQAVAAMYIFLSACLYEHYKPLIDDYVFVTADLFKPEQLTNVGLNLLKILDWNLDITTLYDVVRSRLHPQDDKSLNQRLMINKNLARTFQIFQYANKLWMNFHSKDQVQKYAAGYVKDLKAVI